MVAFAFTLISFNVYLTWPDKVCAMYVFAVYKFRLERYLPPEILPEVVEKYRNKYGLSDFSHIKHGRRVCMALVHMQPFQHNVDIGLLVMWGRISAERSTTKQIVESSTKFDV